MWVFVEGAPFPSKCNTTKEREREKRKRKEKEKERKRRKKKKKERKKRKKEKEKEMGATHAKWRLFMINGMFQHFQSRKIYWMPCRSIARGKKYPHTKQNGIMPALT